MVDNTESPLTILVLSDVHYGTLSVSDEFASPEAPPQSVMRGAVSMKESLLQIAENENINAILVSGDLTSKGNPLEFIGCMSVLTDIAQRLKLKTQDLIYTYGNHDVDWQVSKIPEGSSSDSLKDLYLKIGASVGEVVLPGFRFKVKGPVPGCGVVESDAYRIYVANSGYYCSHNQRYSHGKLGKKQWEWLEKLLNETPSDKKWRVFLIHHHPFNYRYPVQAEDVSCLEEGALLMDLVGGSGIDLVCHGHRHHPMLFTEMRTGWPSPITLLCAGSLAVNEAHRCQGQIPNLFHIVSLEKRLENGAAVGWVKSFEYSCAAGWQAVRYDPRVPLDSVQRFADVYDAKSRNSDLRDVLLPHLRENGESIFEIPKYEDLPLSLQCMHSHELNAKLREVLSEENGEFSIIGKYPDAVMIKRLPNVR